MADPALELPRLETHHRHDRLSCLDDNHGFGAAIGPRWSIIPAARLFETARDRPVLSALRSQRVVHAKPSHSNCLNRILGISCIIADQQVGGRLTDLFADHHSVPHIPTSI
jgi:hypothetical protein